MNGSELRSVLAESGRGLAILITGRNDPATRRLIEEARSGRAACNAYNSTSPVASDYKIGADLEQGYVDAAAGEQVGRCDTGRAGADNREARHLSPAPPGAAPHEA
jgi:hypothetical protein